jgi:hypothetical protein
MQKGIAPYIETHAPYIETHAPYIETHVPYIETHAPYIETHAPYIETNGRCKKELHRPGIEPGSVPWQGTILPLDHRCRRRCRGSNPGHPRDRREYLPLYYNDTSGDFSWPDKWC